jgi:hypothetical protein
MVATVVGMVVDTACTVAMALATAVTGAMAMVTVITASDMASTSVEAAGARCGATSDRAASTSAIGISKIPMSVS